MIDVGRFAKPVVIGDGVLRFGGTDRKTIAAEIHDFADKIARGEILVQRVQAGQIAGAEEWFHQALFIEFVEKEAIEVKRNPPPPIIPRPSV